MTDKDNFSLKEMIKEIRDQNTESARFQARMEEITNAISKNVESMSSEISRHENEITAIKESRQFDKGKTVGISLGVGTFASALVTVFTTLFK